jgi:hypothetical protein
MGPDDTLEAMSAVAELEQWYASRLRPRLVQAARDGKVNPAQAISTDRQIVALIARAQTQASRASKQTRAS